MRNRFGGEDVESGLQLVKLRVLKAVPIPGTAVWASAMSDKGLVRRSGRLLLIANTPT